MNRRIAAAGFSVAGVALLLGGIALSTVMQRQLTACLMGIAGVAMIIGSALYSAIALRRRIRA
jgi:hypothetical protein